MRSLGFFSASSLIHTKAISFNGSDEYVANTTDQAIGISNNFTISIWFIIRTFVGYRVLLDIRNSANETDMIRLQFDGGSGLTASVMKTTAEGGSSRAIASGLSTNTIYNVVLTWNGSTLGLYQDNVSKGSQSGSLGCVNDSNRRVCIPTTGMLDGNIATCDVSRVDVWNTVLGSTSLTSIYNSGLGYKLDLRKAIGNYSEIANLKHQWLLGYDATLTSSDYVNSGGINVYTNKANITGADIVDFA